jgi:hypothetical protein
MRLLISLGTFLQLVLFTVGLCSGSISCLIYFGNCYLWDLTSYQFYVAVSIHMLMIYDR